MSETVCVSVVNIFSIFWLARARARYNSTSIIEEIPINLQNILSLKRFFTYSRPWRQNFCMRQTGTRPAKKESWFEGSMAAEVCKNRSTASNHSTSLIMLFATSSIFVFCVTRFQPSSVALLTRGKIQLSTGDRAVLTSEDFVPIGDSTSTDQTKSSRLEMRMLYSAAGVKMARQREARKQKLAEVSGKYATKHKYIDVSAMERLKMASEGKFYPNDAMHFVETREALRRRKIQKALGDTIAKYFAIQQKA